MKNQHQFGTTGHDYVLVTAANNEEGFIEETINAVASQTVLPKRWVIVSDGSTDRTDQIVQACSRRVPFISFVALRHKRERSFASKGDAIQNATARLRGLQYDFIGNIDADISLEPNYFSSLLQKFDQDAHLGLAGGFVYEKESGRFRSRPFNSIRSVAHGAHLFRRVCYEAVGGYMVFPYGGEDSFAEVSARIKGWSACSFPELVVYHHRATGRVGGLLRNRFRMGLMDYSLGYHPIFELFKCLRRIPETPYLIGASLRWFGFLTGYWNGEKRPVSQEFVDFLREEQKEKLKRFVMGASAKD